MRGGLAITMMAACTQQWEGNEGLGLQPRVAGSSHKVRIGGWAKLKRGAVLVPRSGFTFTLKQDLLQPLTMTVSSAHLLNLFRSN